jgi:hypothetical protein
MSICARSFHRAVGSQRDFWKQTMVGIVRTLVFGFCKWENTGDGSACGAQYPSRNQIDKDACCWLGKDRRKIQDYGIPCRCENSGAHIGLREIGSSLPISSAGIFNFTVFYDVSKSAKVHIKKIDGKATLRRLCRSLEGRNADASEEIVVRQHGF